MKKRPTATATEAVLFLPSSFLLVVLLLSNGYALEITSIEDFKEFSSNVSNGIKNYKGETIHLTNDLDFAAFSSSSSLSSFVPVGKSEGSYFFQGTFDGQGHVISNLNLVSKEIRFLGIFGYSKSIAIKNLVVDSSCSFESSHSDKVDSSSVGSLLGRCDSKDGKCVVEGCVNMASVKYTGSSDKTIFLGGLSGNFMPVSHDIIVENCVNYGNVSSVTPSTEHIRIGGITGEIWCDSTVSVNLNITNTIRNCVNFGGLSNSGKITVDFYMGGISSVDKPNVVYENCVSLGSISYGKSLPSEKGIGAISGKTISGTFSDCFWDDSLGVNVIGERSSNATMKGSVEPFSMTSIPGNTTILDILNNGASGVWRFLELNSNGGSAVGPVIVFLIDAVKRIDLPLPSPVREGYTFDEWYCDENLTDVFNIADLEASNSTLYAKWLVNYFIEFIVDGTLNETRVIPDQKPITFPKNLTKNGFTFDGWYMDNAFKSKVSNPIPATENITFYGRFISTVVEIEFSTKEISKEDVIKKIEEFTGCTDCFTIVEMKEDGNDKGTVIIRFVDVTEARNFVDKIER